MVRAVVRLSKRPTNSSKTLVSSRSKLGGGVRGVRPWGSEEAEAWVLSGSILGFGFLREETLAG
jgi:hypothetical protein